MQEVTCSLDHCFLCRHTMPEWKQIIAGNKKTLLVRKGKSLFREGDQVEGIFFIYSGTVKIHAPWADGREMIIRFAREGDIAGHRGLGDVLADNGYAGRRPDINLYPISATALEDTKACFITNEFLELSMKANPSLTYRFMQFYANELQKAERRMRELIYLDVKSRIAGALLDLLQTFGTTTDNFLALTLTRQDIAAYAGTSYETVFKYFTELTAAGIITTRGKGIRIDHPERLSA